MYLASFWVSLFIISVIVCITLVPRVRILNASSPTPRRLTDAGRENEHQLPWHHGHHFNHSGGGHKKAWMHFENVDGLRNEEVAVFVMSSATRGGSLLRER